VVDIDATAESVAFSQNGSQLFFQDSGRFIRQIQWKDRVIQHRPNDVRNAATDLVGLATPGRAGYSALVRLSCQDQEVFKLIAREMKEPAINREQLARLIDQLRHDNFEMRQKAQEQLKTIGPVVIPTLRESLAKNADLDVRKQLAELMEGMGGIDFHPAGLRDRRLIHLLETLGQPEAIELLRTFAGGDQLAYRTHYAKEALGRLFP